jgi:hypothetical protein
MVRTTPSQLILELYWDNERPANDNHYREKITLGQHPAMGRAADCLDVFATHLKYWTEAAA